MNKDEPYFPSYLSPFCNGIPNVAKTYEGMLFYDPFTMNPKKSIQLPDGSWTAVPAAEYDACRRSFIGQNSCAITDPVYSSKYACPPPEYSAHGTISNACGQPSDKPKPFDMKSNFEIKLDEALKKKKEIDDRKKELWLLKESQNKTYNTRVPEPPRDRYYENFINSLQEERYQGNTYKTPVVPPVVEKTDKEIIEYYIANHYTYGNCSLVTNEDDKDGIEHIDFAINPALDENDPNLDFFEMVEGKPLEYEEKMVSKFMGFSKKKVYFVKKMRVNYGTILEKAKEYYKNIRNK